MESEIELKLLVPENAGELLHGYLESNFSQQYTMNEAKLYNQYYDTADKQLRAHDIGLRVRGKNNQFEQTIKTKGQVVGGLHSRPEYNVVLGNDKPDLSLFEESVWPDSLNAESLQVALLPLFTTHFKRTSFLLDYNETSQIELVFDHGAIVVDEQQSVICEIELELKQGEVTDLCQLAKKIAESIPVRLGNKSKAARGYAMVARDAQEPSSNLQVLSLGESDTNEQAFINAVTYGFEFWQRHQEAYFLQNKVRHLGHVYQGMRLTLQALVLFMPSIDCEDVLALHQRLSALVSEWSWIEALVRIKQFRSRKGLYRKLIDKSPAFLSYLHGRSEGLLIQHDPKQSMTETFYSQLCLDIVNMLHDKPWRKKGDAWQRPIAHSAKSRLTQSWHNIVQIMPYKKSMTAEQYILCEVVLRQTQYNGLFLAGLYDSPERDQFRSLWLDLLSGIKELNSLSFLLDEVDDACKSEDNEESFKEFESLRTWSQDKVQHLLGIMEQSRKQVVKIKPYW
jgi:triphosphatase